ncbi:MAG: hypothetical protein D6736_14045, partial [Nitrospinota bacterium]
PYPFLFRTVNVHILTPTPFTKTLAQDRALVYTALRRGNLFIAYECLADARGFSFTAFHPHTPEARVIMGEEITWRDGLMLEITLPQPAEIHLVKNGKVLQIHQGETLEFPVLERGVYRVEVYRPLWRQPYAWIYSNPIYVR